MMHDRNHGNAVIPSSAPPVVGVMERIGNVASRFGTDIGDAEGAG
jgi:hypothetical protein